MTGHHADQDESNGRIANAAHSKRIPLPYATPAPTNRTRWSDRSRGRQCIAPGVSGAAPNAGLRTTLVSRPASGASEVGPNTREG